MIRLERVTGALPADYEILRTEARAEGHSMLDTLAAAYAEMGSFDEAIAWGSRALEIAGGADKEKLESRIAGFEQRQPVRDE